MSDNSRKLAPVQNAVDDAMRAHIKLLVEVNPEDDDPITDASLLTGWIMVSAWMDPIDGSTRYFRLNSAGMATHEKIGLLREGLF